MEQVQSQQPPARQVETRAPASAALEARRALPRDPYFAVAAAQAGYYVATGLWPILHLRSFMAVTGPKAEGWLVKTVGACIANAGLTLGRSLLPDQRNRRAAVPREVRSLGLRMAVTFAAVDLLYAGIRRRISPVYLVDGVVQLGFIGAWMAARGLRKRDRKTPPLPAFA